MLRVEFAIQSTNSPPGQEKALGCHYLVVVCCSSKFLIPAASVTQTRDSACSPHNFLVVMCTGVTEVAYADTDGDLIKFERNASGGLDYFVNGNRKVSNLTSLRQDGNGTLHLDGTSCGSWGSSRVTTPQDVGVAPRVLVLYSSVTGTRTEEFLSAYS